MRQIHVDYGIKTDLNCDYEKYLAEVGRLQKKYAGQITLRPGIEFGVQVETAAQFTADAARYPFDFIIMSNHQVGNKEFWTYEFQKGRTQEEYQTAYYAALLQMVHCFKDYNVLGHLDMIKRYDKCGDYPDEKIMMIEENLAIAARRGKVPSLRWSARKSDRQHFKELLSSLNLGLEDRLESKVGLLSGGQRQAITLLMTVTRSVIWASSSILWEIYTMPIPLDFRSRMILKSSVVSASVRAAVGSSKTITLARVEIALAISTICWRPTVRCPMVTGI